MSDFVDKDVTDWDGDRVLRTINARLRTYRSVEFLKQGGRLIMRCWHVQFDVSDFKAG